MDPQANAEQAPAGMRSTAEAPAARSAPWLVWTACSAAALTFVAVLGVDVPYGDEWTLVPVLTGHEPVTPAYLWSLHNEHRIAIPRLLYLGLFRLTHDFRAGSWLDVLALCAASALLVAAAGRARGRASWRDAAFPLLLLNPGHAENLLWSFQLAFVLIAVAAAVVLSVGANLRDPPSRGQLLLLAAALLLAPLCSAPGVPMALAGGAWLLWLAVRRESPRVEAPAAENGARPGWRRLAAALGLACWAEVAAYLHGYHSNPYHPAPQAAKLPRRLAEVMCVSFGEGGRWHAPAVVSAVALLLLGTGFALALWWRRTRGDRVVIGALAAALAVVAGPPLAVAWGRSGFPNGAGAAGRYGLLAAPLLCWACLACCRLPWRRAGGSVQAAVVVVAGLLYGENLVAGREVAEQRQKTVQALVRDLRRQLPLQLVAPQHPDVYPDAPVLHRGLEMLRVARLGPWSRAGEAALLRRRFRFLQAPLVEVEGGAEAAKRTWLAGRPAIALHVGGGLVFDVRPGLREAAGFFGVGAAPDDAGESAPPAGAISFAGTYRSDEGETRELFTRVLDPRRPGDRAPVPFRVPLPSSGGKLVLTARAVGVESRAAGWSSWGGFELR